jgi:hypothetical protein
MLALRFQLRRFRHSCYCQLRMLSSREKRRDFSVRVFVLLRVGVHVYAYAQALVPLVLYISP